jgi:hypothetical protein
MGSGESWGQGFVLTIVAGGDLDDLTDWPERPRSPPPQR